MEMAPTGDGTFRMKTRFAKFINVPEMLRMWCVFADVKAAADLRLPTPDLVTRADGKRAVETVPVQPAIELGAFITPLGDRATDVAAQRVAPQDDNMLTIPTDGRKAALDIRLVSPGDPSGPTKIDIAADATHATWLATRENEYPDFVTGRPSAVRGSLQLVLSDIGTPNPDRENAYDEVHLQLVERGIPADSIRFIHEAKNDAEKMGVGTNVQARAVALYHLDCPWRPSTSHNGKDASSGSATRTPEVAIVRFVTERSFDAYTCQGVERKATFIAQIMCGRLDAREVDELDTTTLSAAEATTISSGNPLLLELSPARAELGRLRRPSPRAASAAACRAAAQRNGG